MRRNVFFPELLRTTLAGLTLVLALAATRPLLAHDSTHAAPLKSSGAIDLGKKIFQTVFYFDIIWRL